MNILRNITCKSNKFVGLSNFAPESIRSLASMVKTHRFVYAKKFAGEPKETDFTLETEDLAPIQNGEVLVKAVYLSVDPYMRAYMVNYPVGVTMIGGQVAEVLESKNPKYPVGSTIFGQFGWRSHTVFNEENGSNGTILPYVLPSFGKHPSSLALGVLGMPGITAQFGLKKICDPKPGETVVVTGAAGAVGSIVGQLAKAEGCTVVGLAGDDAKCEWLRSIGFDHAINYKTSNIPDALRDAAPNGFDCYFDNVGGDLSATILTQMRDRGRIAVCGEISYYNLDGARPLHRPLQLLLIFKQLKMEGFRVYRREDRWLEAIENLYKLVDSGKLKYYETITEGFDQMPKAFISMLRGGNTGKAIVKT